MGKRKEHSNIEIREFKMDKMRPNCKIALVGPPGTGKSSVINSILWYFSHYFAAAKVFSGTEDENHFYEGDNPKKPKIPNYYIWNELDEQEVINYVKRQKYVMNEAKKDPKINPWSMLICDDVSDDSQLLNKRVFRSIIKLGRHWKMMFIFAMQYPADLKPTLRAGFDYVFIMQTEDDKSLTHLHENFASEIRDFHDFKDILEQVAKNFAALVIDRTNRESSKLEDKIFYFQPPYPIPDFEFGCTEFREKAKREYNVNYDPTDELIDAVPIKKRR